MVYIFESNIPENKSVIFALTYVYGLNKSTSTFVCKNLGFSPNLKIKNLSKEQLTKLVKIIETLNFELSSHLKKIKAIELKKLLLIKSYIGLRKAQGLPIRGQRTHTNAKTARKRFYKI